MAESTWRMGQWQSFADKEPSAGDMLGTNEAICGCLKVLVHRCIMCVHVPVRALLSWRAVPSCLVVLPMVICIRNLSRYHNLPVAVGNQD